MKKLLILFAVIALIFAADNFPPRKHVGQTVMPSKTFAPAIGEYVGSWVTPYAIYAFNSSGGALKKDWFVIWDATLTLVDSAARASALDTLALDDTTTTYRWKLLRAKWLNTISANTLDVLGLDTLGVAQRETLVVTGSTAVKYFTKLWRKITQAIWRNGAANDTMLLYVQPYLCVTTTTTQNSLTPAGVVATNVSYAADSIVKIYVSGVVQCSLVNTVELTPGITFVSSGTAGYAEGDATPTDGAEAGHVLSGGNTAKALFWVYLAP